ncbi:ABC transporter permease [Williamwhitmania taraxaci]|uniref:Putative ABC transport system permease protein n=1 Tax=Williamwhitmania taraxaci TaxID=1640674 RepID=A0A1G6PY72_9BACT|nr:ABC transporter permease [Williamwhitmania taraxaci]SDC85150.1 putative ABC transport system permease protein [Williamwhitmania taraxaci]
MIRPEILFRRFRRFPMLKAVSIACLAASLACLLLVAAFVKHEVSYDTFNPYPNRLYRLTVSEEEDLPDARCWGSWVGRVPIEVPMIERLTRVSRAKQMSAVLNNTAWPLREAYLVDSTFFTTFRYKLISGDSAKALASPTNVIVSESFAKKHFGTVDVLNKPLLISDYMVEDATSYTIAGVMKDFPENSHFTAELLIGMPKDFIDMAYTYVLLKPNAPALSAEKAIDNILNPKGLNYPKRSSSLQLVTDIHLKSNKAREMSGNGSMQQLLILISAVLLLVIISLINLSNNSRVIFLLNQEYYLMKRVNGAGIGIMILEELLLALISGITVIALGFWITLYLGPLLGIDLLQRLTIVDISILIGGFLLSMLAVMVFPIAKEFLGGYFVRSRGLNGVIPVKGKLVRLKVLVVVQLCISAFVLVVTFGISRQMDYVLSQQLGGKEDGVLVIGQQDMNVISRLAQLKDELAKVPQVTNVCGVMEVPGDAIKDGSRYSLEGRKMENGLSIFCVNDEFFSFFNIKLLAGNFLPKCNYTLGDEQRLLNEKVFEIPSTVKINIDTTAYSDHFVINRSALKEMGFNTAEEAIGKRILLHHQYISIIPGGTIVGVVDDFKYTSLFEKEVPLIIFERKLFQNTILIRYEAKSATEAIRAIEKAWMVAIPNVPFNYKTLSEVYDSRYYNEMRTRKLLGYFSIITLLVSALGLAVIMSFMVKYRLKEIGIRKVNGATSADIFVLLTRGIILWVVLGCAVAFPLAWYAMHLWLQSFAMQVTIGWWIYALGGLGVFMVAFATAFWQSWTAARMKPVEAIRYE